MPKSRTQKPPGTGSNHPLPFEKLSPLDFERLCLWLVQREGYERAEHLGEAGGEQGRDVVAWRADHRLVFQCKRVKGFGPATAQAEIAKLRALPAAEQPAEVVFMVSSAVSAPARTAIRAAWGDPATCHFWAGSELDERVKRHPDVVQEFFQLPAERLGGAILKLPYSSLGEHFAGRMEALAELRASLTRGSVATAIAGKALHGLGGVGKTRLAVEYAWRHRSDYTAVLFAEAPSPADLRRNLAAFAGPDVLDLDESTVPDEAVRAGAVVRWLAGRAGWLLILDNVDDAPAALAVEALLGQLGGGHVLLTSRLASWSGGIEAIELDVLAELEAVAFLLGRTAPKRRTAPDDEARAQELAQELDRLPLALEQAAAYIDRHRLTLAGYLAEWRGKREKVLEWFDERVMNYPASVAVTWQTSVDRLGEGAKRFLDRLAWLGPEPIPEFLLDEEGEQGNDEVDAREALAELAAYSLVSRSRTEATFSVHRLVQEVTRRSQRGEEKTGPRASELERALRWVNAAFFGDPQDVRSWVRLDPLAPHARAVTGHADAAGIAEPTARLMNHLGVLLLAKALHGEAEPLMARVVSIVEASLGANHPSVAAALNNLATLLQATNRLDEAEPLMARVVSIVEASLGANHPNVATALNNLAQLLQDTKRLDEAEPLMRRALEIDEAGYEPEHPKVAIRLNNLAQLLQDTNRLNEAEPLMRRALAIDEASHGPKHPNVATALNNLAALLKATNRLNEAEPLIHRALAIDEASYGPEHPDVARDLNNLATLLKATNRLNEAEPLMARVASIFEASLGANHPKVAIALNNLATLLQDTKRLDEAEPLMRRSARILSDFTRRTGHEHPNGQIVLRNYAGLLRALDKSEAEVESLLAELSGPLP
jgi:tetratricopeptide (TPR) repeat protein